MTDGKDDELERFLTKGGVAWVNLDAIDVSAAIARLIPREMAERLRALPIRRNGSTLMVAFADPYDNSAAEEIGSATALNIHVVRAFDDALLRAFARCY